MSKPFASFFKALDSLAHPGEADDTEDTQNSTEDLERAYFEARQELAADLVEASGLTQQAFSRILGKSGALVQRLLSTPMRWAQGEAMCTALGLPRNALTSLENAREFSANELYINTLDGVIAYQAPALQEAKALPTQYVLSKIQESSAFAERERQRLLDYFTYPTDKREPSPVERDTLVRKLERVLELPALAIVDPDALAKKRRSIIRMSQQARGNVARNVERLMLAEGWDTATLAKTAGCSEKEVRSLLGGAHKLNFAMFFAMAGAFAVDPPTKLMRAPHEWELNARKERTPEPVPEQAQPYANDPVVVRSFLSEYLQLVHERMPGDAQMPTGRAAAILLLTPMLHGFIRMVEANTGIQDDGTMPDLNKVITNLYRTLATQK